MDSKADSFARATRVLACGEGKFEVAIPETWLQGRGAFGGVVLGALLRAALESEADAARVVRCFSSEIVAPVLPGKASIDVSVVRRGRSQTNLCVQLEQAGELRASASVTLSAARVAELPGVGAPPPLAERAGFAEAAPHVVTKGGPLFAQFYEYRSLGPALFSGAEPVTRGFVRERDESAVLDAPALTALLDSFWPALYYRMPRPMPFATVSFSAQYFSLDQLPRASEPLYFRAYVAAQREGYCVEFRELWHDSRLLALNQQTFAFSSSSSPQREARRELDLGSLP